MQPPADVRAAAVAGGSVTLGSAAGVTETVVEDAPTYELRIPLPIAAALRRAVKRVKAEKEFSPACDLGGAEASHALGIVSEAVQHAYGRGWCGPLSSGPARLQALQRLRQTFIEELDALRASLKPGQLYEALHAFDVVREAMDGDETERFVTALKSGDALDLVVEIAHDMRSPLTAILMLTDMVRRQQPAATDEGQQRQLCLVYSAAFGLSALVNDVIALARGGDRLIDREPVPFSTCGLMHSVADMLRPIAEDRKLALRVNTPSVNGRIGHPIALSRVLLNLACNGLKYTHAGEVVISATDVAPTQVRFDITDTGPGIPADVMPVLFEPFGKRPSASSGRRFSRAGLGLAICRKLLRDMGSELRVESAPGQGTRFFFELTLGRAADYDVSGTSGPGPML